MKGRLDRRAPVRIGVLSPAITPERVGIVHLGIGAFHRAHQALLTEDAAAATGDTSWGILGVTQRSRAVVDQLVPQQCLYGVLTVAPGVERLRLVGSVLDVAFARDEASRVLAAIAAPTTHVVTLTVTEKGYARSPDGTLDLKVLSLDLSELAREERGGAMGARSVTAVGLLVRGLAARRRAGGAPLTVLACDNLVDNGHALEGLVREAISCGLPDLASAALLAWLDTHVTFPCSMVDRIVPATSRKHKECAARLSGLRDEALVVGEPFVQWVIEDRFAGPRPAWERVPGVVMADSVAPYEQAKLRMLNGVHSLLAYAGVLAGHDMIADAVGDAEIAAHARALLLDDAAPTVVAPEGVDLLAYAEEVLTRFANPETGHTTRQVASDGTQKLPVRWGPVAASRLALGVVPDGIAYGLASWALCVLFAVRAGTGLDDPRAVELGDTVRGAVDKESAIRALLTLPGLLPPGVGRDPLLVNAVLRHSRVLADSPARLAHPPLTAREA